MKRQLLFTIGLSMLFSSIIFAQEKTEVTVKMKKDGKIVQDTTYHFDDISKAKQALHMMNIISKSEHDHKMIHPGGKAMSNSMVFISNDGEVSELEGDQHVWVTTEEKDGKMEVTIKKISDNEDGKRVKEKKEFIVVDHGDLDHRHMEAGDWDVTEGENGETIMTREEDGKKIKIIKKKVDNDENSEGMEWSHSMEDDDIEVIMIRKKNTGDEEMEIEVIIEDERTKKTGLEEEKEIKVRKREKIKKTEK